jgi:hypothetical protein
VYAPAFRGRRCVGQTQHTRTGIGTCRSSRVLSRAFNMPDIHPLSEPRQQAAAGTISPHRHTRRRKMYDPFHLAHQSTTLPFPTPTPSPNRNSSPRPRSGSTRQTRHSLSKPSVPRPA